MNIRKKNSRAIVGIRYKFYYIRKRINYVTYFLIFLTQRIDRYICLCVYTLPYKYLHLLAGWKRWKQATLFASCATLGDGLQVCPLGLLFPLSEGCNMALAKRFSVFERDR